ncbi:MAG: hypothetical protein JXQ75_07520 [Phycisphaerae bacterium]|nr:hypothetical protein [Phycisphaerae bacterium]
MSISVQCKSCHKRVKAPDRLAGKRARCKCGAVLAIPDPERVNEIAGLSLLQDVDSGGPIEGACCPSCQALMPEGSVLCTSCGFNVKSGRRLAVSVDDAPSASDATEERADKAKRGDVARRPERSSVAAQRVVGIVITVMKWSVIVGAVGGLAWMVKDGLAFSPAEQAEEAQKKIYPGMTVQQVVDALDGKKPQETWVWQEEPDSLMPKLRRTVYRDDFMNATDEELLRYGFYFVYRYSERHNLHVFFTPDGEVDRALIYDPMKALGM